MNRVKETSRAVIEFVVEWNSCDCRHRDSFWAENVSMWRDCLPLDLDVRLIGKEAGDSVDVEIDPQEFHQPYAVGKRVLIRPDQFCDILAGGDTVALHPGRYYPQGLLRGVSAVYPQSMAPCRYLGQEKNMLCFDLNHPLAGRPLVFNATLQRVIPVRVERGGRCEDWLETVTAGGPGMQARVDQQPSDFFPLGWAERQDEREDRLFYHAPRLVNHIDSVAEQTVAAFYGNHLRPGMRVLDFMGSWNSHLPQGLDLAGLAVLGLNEQELAQNPLATERVVQDVNRHAQLPFADRRFDAVICSMSVEYLINPRLVFRELSRVLTDNGLLLVTFSNRWFPSKAIRLWGELHEFERMGLVLELFRECGCFTDLHTWSRRGMPRPADDAHGDLPLSDPVYLVGGRKI
ncbi:MAG: methyltransferase domain-containing protein [Thermodesulfobacteriota bacterium]